MMPFTWRWLLSIVACSVALHSQLTVALYLSTGSEAQIVGGCQRHRSSSKLVIHVGPPKTGSTALQLFLDQHKVWLQETFGITVPMDGLKGMNAIPELLSREVQDEANFSAPHLRQHQDVAENEADFNALREAFNETMGRLRNAIRQPGTLTLISAENLYMLSPEQWDAFLDSLGVEGRNVAISVAFLHRSTLDWYRSVWEQMNEGSSDPGRFSSYLATSLGDHDGQVAGWKRLSTMFGTDCVSTASEEFVLQQLVNTAPWLICNATLGLDGDEWKRCLGTVHSRGVEKYEDANASPPMARIDTVRLARSFWEVQKKAGCRSDFTLTSGSSPVASVANQLPLRCSTPGMWEYAVQQDETWYGLTGAHHPLERSKKPELCFVDEDQLGKHHWDLITSLLAPCL